MDWPNYMHKSKMWQGLKTEGYYMYTVMDNLKRELKNRDRDPNTRLPLLDAWMFFEILTKNTIKSWAQVLEDDAFADQTVVLEDMGAFSLSPKCHPPSSTQIR